MSASLIALFFYLLASMGFSIGADNVGDSISDIIGQQDLSTQVMIQDFLTDPGSALSRYSALGSIYLSADAYSAYMDMQQNGVTASDLNAMGIDYAGWISSNQGNVSFGQVGTLAYKITSDLGQSVVIEWVFDIAEYNRTGNKQYILTLSVYDSSGKLVDFYDTFDGSRRACVAMYGLTADERVKIFVRNSFFSADTMKYYYVNDRGDTITTIDISYYLGTDVAVEGSPVYDDEYAPIGTVNIDGQPYNLNPDGSVTIDGTTYYPNSDGTVTVGGNTYDPVINFPAYNNTALFDLLNLILRLLQELEHSLDFNQDDPLDLPTEVAVSYSGTLSEFVYMGPWATVFPFCLPWDLYRGIKLLSSEPEAPKFEIPFNIPAFGLFQGYSSKIVLDFTDYYKYFYVVRWFTTVLFVASLIFITFKIVKGAR